MADKTLESKNEITTATSTIPAAAATTTINATSATKRFETIYSLSRTFACLKAGTFGGLGTNAFNGLGTSAFSGLGLVLSLE